MAHCALHAALYDLVARAADAAGMAERRGALLSQACGEVLEVGAGTGRNLAHYRGVERVRLLEPDGAMRRRLNRRLGQAAVPAVVVPAGIHDARLPAGAFDTVVCTFVLCTVADLARALAAIRRLVRPDGRLLFLEHVAGTGLKRRIQTAVTPLWRRLAGGCHLDRQTTIAIREAGFVITDCERLRPRGLGLLTGDLVQGVARPRAGAAA